MLFVLTTSVTASGAMSIGDCLDLGYGDIATEHKHLLSVMGVDAWSVMGELILTDDDTYIATTHIHEAGQKFAGRLWWYAWEGQLFVFVQRHRDDANYPHGVCFLKVAG